MIFKKIRLKALFKEFIAFFCLLSFLFSPSVYAICYPYPTIEATNFVKDCKPYRAIGVNYFDAFSRVLKNPQDKSYIQGFEKLSKAGIPFVRMMAGGFWPKDWELYLKNKKSYFLLLDQVVKTAEKYNIGIIMSLFWNVSTIPDIVGEPVSAWGNNYSKTIDFMKTYTKEIVSRYKNSPAIWGWEFGNEYSNVIDLPGVHYPKIAPQFGTPSVRTEKDKLKWYDLITALIIFSDTVREIDKLRIISTGNSVPRPSSYHLAFYQTWGKDTKNQFTYMLNLLNPELYNTISVHLYPPRIDSEYFSEIKIESFKALINSILNGIPKNRRVLYVGEFGVCSGDKHIKDKNDEINKFKEFLNAIQSSSVSLAILWVYNMKNEKEGCNVTFDNDRSYQLQLIIEINKKIFMDKE